MKQQTQCFSLILWGIIAGSLSVPWDMKVSPVVSVPRGEDAVLGCSFTHPSQQKYSGTITAQWRARELNASPFFSCSLKNDSMEEPNKCSVSEFRYSLVGDPRRGELSLLIRRVNMLDNGTYFCKVKLDGWMSYFHKETQLYVTVKPRVLSLSVVETSPGTESATRRLQCEAEGHPLPTITWLSASRSPLGDQDQTSQTGPARVVSSVPYLEQDVFTCRVESRLGAAERTYPAATTPIIPLSVCGLVLLLLSTGSICCMRQRARPRSHPVHVNAETARADTSPIYENADVGENVVLQGSDCPAGGDVELQLVYSTITLTSGLKTRHEEEPGVHYSLVSNQE